MSTINAILPVIKHVVNDKNFYFQYHIMKTTKDYTSFLNPGQCTVGSADQSVCYQKEDTVVASTTILDHEFYSFVGILNVEQGALVVIGYLSSSMNSRLCR